MPVSVCAICDKDRDPLDVPTTSCGHSPEKHRRTVSVPVVPARELLKFAEWLERDRREPDKVLCVVQSMRRAAR
jgi:hypothetical protein